MDKSDWLVWSVRGAPPVRVSPEDHERLTLDELLYGDTWVGLYDDNTGFRIDPTRIGNDIHVHGLGET